MKSKIAFVYYIVMVSPMILLGLFVSKLNVLSCINTTDKMYMLLIAIFIYAYSVKNYFERMSKS